MPSDGMSRNAVTPTLHAIRGTTPVVCSFAELVRPPCRRQGAPRLSLPYEAVGNDDAAARVLMSLLCIKIFLKLRWSVSDGVMARTVPWQFGIV
jgi:hypothetical protein